LLRNGDVGLMRSRAAGKVSARMYRREPLPTELVKKNENKPVYCECRCF